MDYIKKLDLQTEEVKEVETLEKHTIVNNKPFSVDEYEGHDRDFLAVDGEYDDGFNQLKETNGLGINCIVSKRVREMQESLDNMKTVGVNILSFDGKDETEKFQNALNSDYYTLEVPNVTITRPLTVPWNRGKIIRGIGGLKRGVINVQFDEQYADRSAIEYITNESREHNWAGITIENIHLIGNNSKTSGIKLQYVCYPLFNNVLIEGFRGHGLLIDKCQDGSFNNLIIQQCGRSNGDGTVNSETTHAPLEFITTMETGHCNMLRFNDCQIEENKVSPFIRFSDSGAIGIWFNNAHFEIREGNSFNKYDLFEINGGDVDVVNSHVSPTFRNGYIYKGYGILSLINCKGTGNILMQNDGCNASLNIINSSCDIVSCISALGHNNIVNSTLESLQLNYPSGIYNIRDCEISSTAIDNKGTNPIITMDNIHGDYLYFNQSGRALKLRNSHFTTLLKFEGAEGECINSTCDGLYSINKVDNILINKEKVIYDTQPPIYGYWAKGSKVYNTEPSVGSYVGWICIESGNSGIWKPFGAIVD